MKNYRKIISTAAQAKRRLSPAEVEKALAHAEDVCTRHGARLTELRRYVLQLILGHTEVVKAYDLLSALKNSPYSAKPPTVYRALEFLQEHDLVHRIESMNGYIACGAEHWNDCQTQHDHQHTGHFLICVDCHAVEEKHWPDVDHAIDNHLLPGTFTLQKRVLELKGTCADCQQKAA